MHTPLFKVAMKASIFLVQAVEKVQKNKLP